MSGSCSELEMSAGSCSEMSGSCSEMSGSPFPSAGSPPPCPGSKKRAPRASPHVWTKEETRAFLNLLHGTDKEQGYYQSIVSKKMQRTKAMEAISTNLSTNFGFSITAAQADNKWKALLKDFRQVEDANNRSGAAPMEPPGGSFGLEVHQMMEEIVGEKASSRPALLVGSGLPQASPRSAAARPVSVRKAEVSLAGLSLAKNSEAAWRAESPSMAMSGQERFKPPPWSKASSTSTPSRSASASSVSTPVSDDELELERDFGLLPNKDATEGATSTQVESMKRRSPPFSQPESKRKRRRPAKSASNEMLSWAGEYGQQQQKIQENFQEQLKEQHQEKMKAMQDLVNILARAVDK